MSKYSRKLSTGRYLQVAKVTGVGIFPLDMLRRDCCYPRGSDDVSELHRSVVERAPNLISVTVSRTVQYANDEWNARRWASFGWRLREERA